MNTYDKPKFNGLVWVVEEKNKYGLTVQRHKFETEKQANTFYNKNTEQPKAMLGGSENK